MEQNEGVNYSALQNLLIFRELSNFFYDLNNYKYALIKGEALSIQEYGTVGKRSYNDIDILICKDNATEIINIAKKHGFKFSSPENEREQIIKGMMYSHQMPPLIKYFHGIKIEIDLNIDIFWSEYKKSRISMDEYLNYSTYIQIYNNQIKVLDIMHSFLQVILHNYRELNSIYILANTNMIPEKLFKDIYMLLINNSIALSPHLVLEESRNLNITQYVYYMIHFTSMFYSTDRFVDYEEALYSDKAASLLDKFGLDNQYKWNMDFNERIKCDQIYKVVAEQIQGNEEVGKIYQFFYKKGK